jgi:hypothetical protein
MDGQRFIAGRFEAVLAAFWLPLIALGVALGSVVTPIAWGLVPLGFVAAAVLVWHVQGRMHFPPEDRRLLRLWLSTNGQYNGWMTLLGKRPPGSSNPN